MTPEDRERIRRLVDEAPPLGPEQRAALRELLRPTAAKAPTKCAKAAA